MQLCRFILREQPNIHRSGILHDGRIYETDGTRAIGVHEMSAIGMLPPLASAPNVRLFDVDGRYTYRSSSSFLGPLAELEPPQAYDGLVAQVHAVAVLKEGGAHLEQDETENLFLAFTLAMTFSYPGADMGWDLPMALGPYLTTPEEFDLAAPLKMSLALDGNAVAAAEAPLPDFGGMAMAASKWSALEPGDVLISPALGTVSATTLMPGHRVSVVDERLGTLVIRLT